jgi:hypothetical protein
MPGWSVRTHLGMHQEIDPSSWNQEYPRKGFISTVFTKIAKLSRLEKVVV